MLETLPSIIAGNAVIADIEEIQKGLTDLPRDILKLIMALEHRLQEVESMLATMLSEGVQTTSASSIIPSATDYLPIPASSETPATTPAHSALCHPPAGAGPLVPCPTLQHTWTNISRQTVTKSVFQTFHNQTTRVYGSGTATSLYPTAPYASQNTSAPTMTITVAYASETISTVVSGSTFNSTFVIYSLQPSPSPYIFQADAEDNVAVYYGTTTDTQEGGLLALCEDPNVDIAIVSFVFEFFGPQGYPSMNFGPGCSAPNAAQSEQASGLMNCTALAPEIAGCQQIGKKVLVSLGGYLANTSFVSDDQASQFAATLWHLFGAGTDDPDLRPFGTGVTVDGFDIDNENHNTSYYQTFADALRQQFSYDDNKTYYLSAAPQCPMPDESIPVGAMTAADFVWVQFYNNPACNLDSDGFQSSFAAWSANLSSSSTIPGKPRIYIGAGAFEGAGSGYVQGPGLSSVISVARELYVHNLGGIMLWDGSEAMANVDQNGVDYLDYAKSALHY